MPELTIVFRHFGLSTTQNFAESKINRANHHYIALLQKWAICTLVARLRKQM